MFVAKYLSCMDRVQSKIIEIILRNLWNSKAKFYFKKALIMCFEIRFLIGANF